MSIQEGNMSTQGTKKLVSDSPGPMDFAVRLVGFTLNLPKRRVKVFGEIVFEEIRVSCKIELRCALLLSSTGGFHLENCQYKRNAMYM